jgi:hypothetical protein
VITWGNKISEALKGRTFSEERRKNMSDSHRGFHWSEEEKEKRRLGMLGKNKGHVMSEEQKQFFSKLFKGVPLTEEHKRKISLGGKGKIMSEEAKEKIRKSLMGRKHPWMQGLNNPYFTHPTSYKSIYGKSGFRQDLGLAVRSTWEANIIRVLKFLGFSVMYEPMAFYLSDGSSYIPDLFLPETNEIIEIKGRMISKAFAKINLFKKEYPFFSFDLIDKDKYVEYKKEFQLLIPMWEEG